MADLWGLSLNQTLLLLALILIVIDFFFPSDVPTHTAYLLLCALVAVNVPGHFLVKLLCAIIAWFGLVAFHYLLWRKVIQRFANKHVAPDLYKSGANGLAGSTGTVKKIEDKLMVKVADDLWPFESEDVLGDGDTIEVAGTKDGALLVRLKEGD